MTETVDNRRVLVVDDEPEVRDRYLKILGGHGQRLAARADSLFAAEDEAGVKTETPSPDAFTVKAVDQGEAGVAETRAALDAGRPFAVAFIDMRMPPGIDGLETARLIREMDREIYIVIVTAHSDRSPEELHQAVGYNILLLKKPFDRDEILQLARTLCQSWNRDRQLEREQAERMRLIAQSTNQARLASLGEMTTGIMHEVNQPLSYVSALVQSQRRARQKGIPFPDEKLGEMLDESMRQIDRIGKIMNHLRTFARGDAEDKARPTAWGTVLDNALLLMGQNLRNANIELVRDMADPLPIVLGNESAFEQILINLLQNSVHALEGRKDGRIEIGMRVEEGREKGEGGRVLELRFSDNGAGMPPEVRDKCFEPFYTTKGVGQGTGIGLSLVHGIVAKYGGTIAVSSTPEVGTTFTLHFPVEASA